MCPSFVVKFPTVNLPEVNFEALLQQRIAEMQAAKEKEAPAAQA